MNIKKSLRIIFRNKIYSVLNIMGLAVGITSAALVFLWVGNNLSFNRSIPNSKNLYMIGQHQHYGDDIQTFMVNSAPVPVTLDSDFPEIKRNTRAFVYGSARFVPENTTDIFSERGNYVDPTFFDMLDMVFIRGNKETVFTESAFPVVLSEKMAEKIYGEEDPIGKRLQMREQFFEVTGVFKELPKNTSFQYDWLIPFRIAEEEYTSQFGGASNWRNNWMQCYVEVEPTADIRAINLKLSKLIPDRVEGDKTALFIYPINRLKLYGEFKDGIETGTGFIQAVRLFFIIGIIILLIACINFMNLSTARSQKRALEVGVRKTFGTKRKALIKQFMFESGLITFISLLIAVGLIYLFLPSFNKLISLNLALDWSNPWITFGLLAIGVICTVTAGSYPAFYLSSFSPIDTLKKQKTGGNRSATWIRKGLVIFQFTIAFVLICTTYVVYLQIQHAQNRDLGINKENLIVFEGTPEIKNSFSAVENELINTGMVESIGLSDQYLFRSESNGDGYNWNGKEPDINPLVARLGVSSGLIETAGLTIVEGRSFYPYEKDEDGYNVVIINQTMAEMMGEEGKVGRYLNAHGTDREIVGIVKNFVFNNMYEEKPDPVAIFPSVFPSFKIFVRLKPDAGNLEAVSKIVPVLRNFSPTESFDPFFMDDEFNKMFSSELLQGKLSGLFAGLTVFISCLGLFGLSAFSAEQRTREIGIRKVLGASIWNILVILGKSYITLIAIALVIGTPIAIYIVTNYLDNYAYRISVGWQIFASVALLVIVIALLTMSFQTLRAAMANPVKSIKTE